MCMYIRIYIYMYIYMSYCHVYIIIIPGTGCGLPLGDEQNILSTPTNRKENLEISLGGGRRRNRLGGFCNRPGDLFLQSSIQPKISATQITR